MISRFRRYETCSPISGFARLTPHRLLFAKVRKADQRHPSQTPRLAGLIAIHGHSLRISAELSVRRWRDRPAAGHATSRAGFLQGQQLLGSERLVVYLARGLNEVLQVCSGEEVS